jgi:DNA primase
MNSWLTTDEMKEVRKQLAKTVNFENIAKRHTTRMEAVSSATWTHKCICPFHKNGNERTPSLCISDKEKIFFCYGCSVRGDVFDFIGMIRGAPGETVALRYKESKNISIDISDLEVAKPKVNIYEISLQLSVSIREYVSSFKNTEKYNEEILWTDGMFKRIDERFMKLSDECGDDARNFYMQIMLELERRKNDC